KDEHKNLVTIGYGPDFSIIRSEGVEMDIPRLVRELQQEINAGVEGGGHLVVGSIKFIPAKRKDVLARLASKIGEL
ncbi:MAG: phosphoesterase, partial [Archaeoglobaceae archaeon]